MNLSAKHGSPAIAKPVLGVVLFQVIFFICSIAPESDFLFISLSINFFKKLGGILYPFAILLPISGYSSFVAGVVPNPSTYLLNMQNAAAIKTVSCISSSIAPFNLATSMSSLVTSFPLF